jgi:hypothetical protein
MTEHRTFWTTSRTVAVGPFLTLAAAAALAIAVAMTPASDRPVFPAGPLSGHSILHFPR